MVNLGGDLLVLNGLVQAAHLGEGQVLLLHQFVQLAVAGGLLLRLGRARFLGLGLRPGGAGLRVRGLVGLVGPDCLAQDKDNRGGHAGQDIVQRPVQGQQQSPPKPKDGHKVKRSH